MKENGKSFAEVFKGRKFHSEKTKYVAYMTFALQQAIEKSHDGLPFENPDKNHSPGYSGSEWLRIHALQPAYERAGKIMDPETVFGALGELAFEATQSSLALFRAGINPGTIQSAFEIYTRMTSEDESK